MTVHQAKWLLTYSCKNICIKKNVFYTKNGKHETYSYRYNPDNLHREDGPAIEFNNGDRVWYQNGKLHRLDGPAIELANGKVEYWINDKLFSKEDFEIEAPFYNHNLEILI